MAMAKYMNPAVAVLAVLTGCGSSASHPAAAHTSAVSAPNPTAAPSSAAPSPAATHHARHLGPAATVRAYFKAINRHDYGRAWRLGGRHTGGSYAAFASGFAGTEHDAVTILSVAGNVVRARLAAQQTDGSVKTYEGTYRVNHGVITGSDVAQVFPTASTSPGSGGCYPTASTGNCYEPGEYCPTADAGMTGVAGDGKTITCVLESGRYHWHPVS
jgi:hypothetical protein